MLQPQDLYGCSAACETVYDSVYERVTSTMYERPSFNNPIAAVRFTEVMSISEVLASAVPEMTKGLTSADADELEEKITKTGVSAVVGAKEAIAKDTDRGLNVNELASIHAYTQERPVPFYKGLNAAMGGYDPTGGDDGRNRLPG